MAPSTYRYMALYKCRLCHQRFHQMHTEAKGRDPRQVLQAFIDAGSVEVPHLCQFGDVGVGRLLGIRPEIPANYEEMAHA
jgi:hypothetical protein